MTPERHRHDGEGLAGYSPPLLKPKGRARWIVFVALNLLTYLAACVFWHYLRSGQWVDFTAQSYRRGLTPFVGRLMLKPVSIFSEPWMAAVIALTLALLIVLPLMTAVMYQLLLAMVFVVILAVVGHAPLLALALAAACLMAARTRLRRDFPFLAAAFGLLPVCVYLYFAHVATDVDMLQPLQQWLLAIPLVGAVAVALLAEFGVVMMARLTRFQPGVLWPVSLVLLPAAVGLFFWQVGPAELHYAMLVDVVRPREALLPPVPVGEVLGPQASGLNRHTLPVRIHDDLDQRRSRLTHQCRQWLDRFPDSSRRPEVAWMLAQAESLQVDRNALSPGEFIIYTAAWPLPVSQPDWQALLESYPNSDQAALARKALATLRLRSIDESTPAEQVAGRVREAEQMLRQAREQLIRIIQQRREQENPSRVLSPLPPVPATGEYVQALKDIRYLLWIMESNAVLPPRQSGQPYDTTPARALAAWLRLNPYQPAYAERLQALAAEGAYGNTRLGDNLAIAVAKLETNLRRRAEALQEIAADQSTDASIEAYFELGRIAMQTATAQYIRPFLGLKDAKDYFQVVVAAPPSPFQDQARADLQWLAETANSTQADKEDAAP
jgi:hypothetical protein